MQQLLIISPACYQQQEELSSNGFEVWVLYGNETTPKTTRVSIKASIHTCICTYSNVQEIRHLQKIYFSCNGKIVSFDFLIFHRLYLRTVNNLQGEYSSFLSILSTSEAGCISTFLPYWLHHIGYKQGSPPLPIFYTHCLYTFCPVSAYSVNRKKGINNSQVRPSTIVFDGLKP